MIGILLCTSIVLVYAVVLTHGFINLDDDQYLLKNPHVMQGLTMQGIFWSFTSFYASNWHPLTWLSHMADVQFFGMRPGFHHAMNVILHALSAVVLFITLRLMTGATFRSAAVAALFALHPLHVESVAWIAERKDVLSTLLGMLTMLAYIRYVRRPAMSAYALMICCYILGLLAKPMLVTLPFVLLLMDFWPLRRMDPAAVPEKARDGAGRARSGKFAADLSRLVMEKVPLMVLAAASSVITLYAQGSGGSVVTVSRIPILARVANVLTSYATYLGKTLWPAGLSIFYPYPEVMNPVLVMVSAAVLAGITVFVFMRVRTMPYLAAGWLWYLGTLVPVIGIVQVGEQAIADRYTYLPLVGVFIMVVWGVADLASRWPRMRGVLPWAFLAVLMLLMVSAHLQVRHWKNSETLFTHALAVTRNNHLAHNNLGSALLEARGDIEGAVAQYRQAVAIRPYYLLGHYNLGIALFRMNRYEEALAEFQECIRINPAFQDAHAGAGNALFLMGNDEGAIRSFLAALQINRDRPDIWNNLGSAYLHRNSPMKAAVSFQEALRLNPGFGQAAENLEKARGSLASLADAAGRLEDLIRVHPAEPALHRKLGEIYFQYGNHGRAIQSYQQALAINSEDVQALYGIVLVHADQGEYDRAVEAMLQIHRLQPDNADVLYNIACLHARGGRADDATRWLMRAVEKGFSSWELLRTDPDLEAIRDTPEVRELLEAHAPRDGSGT
ncbi:MAG TPA: tetratricopeptide repeat protein [Deltaproteobacteria bacterium]|nr:tetratricopeptide repeat protein [Deltaproteobacteria bacterium]